MDEKNIHPLEEFWVLVSGSDNALDPELVREFRDNAREKPWKPLGRVLIDLGHLNFAQAAAIIRVQADEPTARFGDLAVREGYCSVSQVQEALDWQRKAYPGPIELMLQDDRFDRGSLLAAFGAYVRHLEGSVLELRKQLASVSRV